jgi:hypothetical protein
VRSAQRLVLRQRWPRRPGNDGTARVGVPAGAEKSPERHVAASDRPDGDGAGGDDRDVWRAISVLEEAVATLREELTRANARADSERDQAGALRERIEDLQSRVAMASGLEAEQGRLRGEIEAAQVAQAEAEADAAELRDQLDQTRVQAEAALQEAVELKAAAEAAGRGGRWTRLKRAWRGE